MKYDTRPLSSVTMCSCLEPECVVLREKKKPDFQQGQQQSDVLEALLVRGQVGTHLKCSKTVKESADADRKSQYKCPFMCHQGVQRRRGNSPIFA
jgi:hypothetical protein